MDEYEKNRRRSRLQNKKHKDNAKRERKDRFKAECDEDWMKEQEELIKLEEDLMEEEWEEFIEVCGYSLDLFNDDFNTEK